MLELFSHPLILVEVIPLVRTSTKRVHDDFDEIDDYEKIPQTCPPISTSLVKMQLMRMSRDVSSGGLKLSITLKESGFTQRKTKHFNNGDPYRKVGFGHSGYQYQEPHQAKSSLDHNTVKHVYNKIVYGTILYDGKESSDFSSQTSSSSVPITYMKSDDPLCEQGVPCFLRGYFFETAMGNEGEALIRREIKCSVSYGSSVQLLPSIDVRYIHILSEMSFANNALHQLYNRVSMSMNPDEVLRKISDDRFCDVEETSLLMKTYSNEIMSSTGKEVRYSKLSCYEKETIQSLITRMSMMLTNILWIGTTPHAFSIRKKQLAELKTMAAELETFWTESSEKTIDTIAINDHVTESCQNFSGGSSQGEKNNDSSIKNLLQEGALLLHNSHPNSGKTTLVTTVAKDILNCHEVHVISAPTLFAKYGAKSNDAFETILHDLVLRAAVRGASTQQMGYLLSQPENDCSCIGKICVILDHFECFLQTSFMTSGDKYSNVSNAMSSYLKGLIHSLKVKSEFPFPSSNPLYNVCGPVASPPGFAIPFSFCLVGVMTCTDNVVNSRQNNSILHTALHTIGGGRLHVSLPSAATRLHALHHAFKVLDIELEEDTINVLPQLIASMNWASGGMFLDIAKALRSIMDISRTRMASKSQMIRAVSMLRSNRSKTISESTSSVSPVFTTSRQPTTISFFSVGGNREAKLALEDALALNPRRRELLSAFGLQAPTGVLLYGPPGTGKTLLARDVAHSLSIKVNKSDGAFICLKASDIVRPEIGNSEKLIVLAFEAARKNAPSVVFMDEFQALFGNRSEGSYIQGQLVTTLLQCMDDITRWNGLESPNEEKGNEKGKRPNDRVVLLAATNTPWMIDKAFLRPGRFDRAVHVGLPGVEEREEILRVHIERMKLAQIDGRVSQCEKICKSMADLCVGFSGADLAALCRAAAVRCVSEGNVTGGVTEKHFYDALKKDITCSSDDSLAYRNSTWKV